MADPFEVRMRFTSQLQHLNASTTSALKAANYALRYAEFSDDLHSCILEQLERNNMNNRANIMYFLPALCDAAKAQGEAGYVRMIERDILRIIDLVAPDDGSGAANVKVVRKVLQQLQQKAFLQPRTVLELEECIAGRESAHGARSSPPPPPAPAPAPSQSSTSSSLPPGGFAKPAGMSNEALGGGAAGGAGTGAAGTAAGTGLGSTATAGGGGSGGGAGVQQGGGIITPAMRSTPQSTTRDAVGHHNAAIRLDKRQIEQRIEEDRERHKRAREGIWAIPQPTTNLADDAEFDKFWDEAAGADEDDNQKAREEGQERAKHLEFDEY